MYDMPQIRLQDLLSGIPNDDIQEIWQVSYITTTSTQNIIGQRVNLQNDINHQQKKIHVYAVIVWVRGIMFVLV